MVLRGQRKNCKNKNFRLKHHASCRELQARKLLRRLSEALLMPEILIQSTCNHPLVRNHYKWIKKDNSINETTVKADQTSRSNQESLAAILHFWQGFWGWDRPAVDDAFQQQQSIPISPALPWGDLTAYELHNQVLRQEGSAVGPDGLDGSELAHATNQSMGYLIFLSQLIDSVDLSCFYSCID